MSYVELQVTSNYSFLEGAAHPDQLIRTAAFLGHPAMALTDRNTLTGVVRAHKAAKKVGIRLVVGCRLDFLDRPSLLCFPTDLAAYSRLSRLLTLGKRRAPKGECHLRADDLPEHAEGQIIVLLPPDDPDPVFADWLRRDRRLCGDALYLAAQHLYRGDDVQRLDWLGALAGTAGVPLVATNDVLYHEPGRRRLQDVLACIRLKCTIETAGRRLGAHAERHLKLPGEMARLFRGWPQAVARTVELAARCRFSLDELRYEYPTEMPAGRSPQQELEIRARAGLAHYYGDSPPPRIAQQVEHELALIGELGYASYFLTVHEIVLFAKSRDILCQGRGSAANSVVCYCLGITAVEPGKIDLLFERFISKARNEPPDIDVDFAHERREEVIQFIYAKYGRERAGLTAIVVCYRMRGALRDAGKAMGLSVDVVNVLSSLLWGSGGEPPDAAAIAQAGLDPADPRLALVLELAAQLVGFPRHLSQHVGGFVITQGILSDLVPITNAAMADRTVIEWDKDDLDALGILKIDVLALGMLTCIDKAFDLIQRHYGGDHPARLELTTVPQDVPAVYDMLCLADTVGVFQIESRAQMSMLPRLKPREFYDLVIEVAIVRPGPIQGDMVHPYLRRRDGIEAVDYPSEALREVLEKTRGVPLFQEQAMRIAMVAAGFSADEADELRRAMATFKRVDLIGSFRERMIGGMVERGYDPAFATRCFKQIEGFGTYGFPESHAASFALLVYISAWIKWKYPEIFAAALLNSQPMGFYAPAQIVRDAREHHVEVLPVDVNMSDWDNVLEARAGDCWALRLGFRQIGGFKEDEARLLVAARGGGYGAVGELVRRADLGRGALDALARADAFRSLGHARRAALWAVKGLDRDGLALFPGRVGAVAQDPAVTLPRMSLGEHVVQDYEAVGLSLKRHPLALLRAGLAARKIHPCAVLATASDGRRAEVAGLVLVRQRPGTAKGTVFMTLEDETGIANIIVWPAVYQAFRRIVLTARLVAVRGAVHREGLVVHLVAERIVDLSAELDGLDAPPGLSADSGGRELRVRSRDFH